MKVTKVSCVIWTFWNNNTRQGGKISYRIFADFEDLDPDNSFLIYIVTVNTKQSLKCLNIDHQEL